MSSLTTVLDATSDIAGVQMPNVILWVLALAAIAGALHTLWTKVVKPFSRMVRTIHATYEKVMEYDDRLNDVENNTAQLTRNSGSHVADAIYRIESAQSDMKEQIDTHKVSLADHLLWSTNEAAAIRGEVSEVWKTLAARDTVKAALKTAEIIDAQETNKDQDKG